MKSLIFYTRHEILFGCDQLDMRHFWERRKLRAAFGVFFKENT
jgi:hypothetical protein